ncbi:hypothetical protein TDB9533_03270 [Thalassocella blandensis]|nr:hypothetical protein TDB9533_03270 [Thalassocella blandensis]
MQFVKQLFISSTLLVLSSWASAQFNDKEPQASLKAVGNADVSAIVYVNGEKLEVSGQSSFYLSASQESLEKGVVNIGAINFAFFKVPQSTLNFNGDKSDRTGNLSFAADGEQTARYDEKSKTIRGEIEGVVGATYMGDYADPIKDSKEGDHNFAPRQKSKLQFEIQLQEALVAKESEKPQESFAKMRAKLHAETDQRIGAYELQIEILPEYRFEQIFLPRIEVAKRLCVRPVRFSRLIWSGGYFSFDYTGDGLAFGQPEANKQWAKADVVFTWREFATVYNPTLFNFSTSEASAVLNSYDEDDCVEVFFVEGDAGMHSGWGGGASFNGGESYTKIISSDGNAHSGIDKVHLAHELGHSMDLPHPNYYNASSTNTLMCPSGFANDNPARNSQENKNNIANPLFTFALKLVSAGPDCTNSADCGTCP